MFVLIVTRKPSSAKMTVLSANTGLERNSQFSHQLKQLSTWPYRQPMKYSFELPSGLQEPE